jgi:hypothetical protein
VPIFKLKSTERKLCSTKPTPINLFDGFIPDVRVGYALPVHDHADLDSCKSNITSHRVHLYAYILEVSVLHVNWTFVRFTHDAYNEFRT